jgi:hypothetical protein
VTKKVNFFSFFLSSQANAVRRIVIAAAHTEGSEPSFSAVGKVPGDVRVFGFSSAPNRKATDAKHVGFATRTWALGSTALLLCSRLALSLVLDEFSGW